MAGKKAKAKNPPQPAPGPNRWVLAWVATKVLFALAFVVGTVAAIAWIGGVAGERVSGNERYSVRVAEIHCDAPSGTDRSTFLTEVRYLADLPETVQNVDPELAKKLSLAFARHPWVQSVNGVRVEPNGAIHVDLTFRTPVLAVTVIGEKDLRVVDKTAVLLPAGASSANLPLLVVPVLPPQKSAGEVWDDPTVKRAAELAEAHKPKRIEKTDKGWRLIRDNGPPLLVGW